MKTEKSESKSRRRTGQVLPPNAEAARLKKAGKDLKDYRGNKWLVRIFLGLKSDGKPNYHNETIHGTRAQAEEWLRAALVRKDKGEPIKDPDIFFSDLFEEWLGVKVGKRTQKTIETYRDYYDYYVKVKFGALKISTITSREIQKWVIDMVEAEYAAETIQLAYTCLRAPIRYALIHDMLRKDPTRGVEIPGKSKRKANVLLPEEAAKALKASRDYPGGAFAAFLIWSGARPNEAGALKWQDIDWTNGGKNDGKGRITIQRNLVRMRNGGGWQFEEPKTEAGIRSFTMPAEFMEQLRTHRTAQLEHRMKLGEDWEDHDLVFPEESGAPIERHTYRRIWAGVLKTACLSEERQKMRPYDSRHSAATLLLIQRTPTKLVADRLGHSSTVITENIYQHVMDRLQDQATDDLEDAIYGRKKNE
ncbi:MAG: site-specific integrase [Blastocatellia bacterium]|nr:site-specific integrase [Blastocatellia bacterium]